MAIIQQLKKQRLTLESKTTLKVCKRPISLPMVIAIASMESPSVILPIGLMQKEAPISEIMSMVVSPLSLAISTLQTLLSTLKRPISTMKKRISMRLRCGIKPNSHSTYSAVSFLL